MNWPKKATWTSSVSRAGRAENQGAVACRSAWSGEVISFITCSNEPAGVT
ncbi:hypothetical protein AB0M47_18125 [Hamadaea sp. NPDC051192]